MSRHKGPACFSKTKTGLCAKFVEVVIVSLPNKALPPIASTNLEHYRSFQGTDWKIYLLFQKIADNAGLGTAVRPFDNMRMSRSNEVLRPFGEVKESLWIGHSSAVMKKHYFWLSDADFSAAAEASGKNTHAKSHTVLGRVDTTLSWFFINRYTLL